MSTNDPDSDQADDQFIRRLRAQSPARLPAHWRADILAAARLAVVPSTATTRVRRIAETLGAWLWPHPRAYVGLLLVWLVALALHLATPSLAPSTTRNVVLPTAGMTDYPLALASEQLAINTALSASLPQRENHP